MAGLLAWLASRPAEAARYVVQEGDTLPKLAQRYLGSYTRWPEILFANPQLRSEPLRPGMEIELPLRELVELESAPPTLAPWPEATSTSLAVASPVAVPTPLPTSSPRANPTPRPTPSLSPRATPIPSPAVVRASPSAFAPTVQPAALPSPLHSLFLISYQPWQYSENLSKEKISAGGFIGRSLFTQWMWRPIKFLMVEAGYSFSYYQTSRVATKEQATRQQDLVRVGASGVFELVPRHLDWAIGVGGEWENFAVFLPSSGVSEGRVNDIFDLAHQRLGVSLRTRLGARPFAQFPLAFWLEAGFLPFISVQQKEAVLPASLMGLDGQAGAELGLGPLGFSAAFFLRQQMGTNYTSSAMGGRFGLGVSF